MDCLTILAEAVKHASRTPQETRETIIPVDIIWQHITSLNVVEALTFISFGAICLLYGWRIFKMLVVISFGMLGLAIGVLISKKIGGNFNPIFGGIAGLLILAAMSMSLMKWSVCILGAIAGGIVTGGIWHACGLSDEYIWAGALIGIVAGGMISFIILKISVMLFSSLEGSLLAVTGILALLYLYPQTTEKVEELVFVQRWFLPVALIAPTLIGMFVQNKFIKKSGEWSI